MTEQRITVDENAARASPGDATPLVSCLMVSRGDGLPARFAIDCYRAQTYPRRELVIVCDTPKSELSSLVSALSDPSIKYVETPRMVLGELRNASVAAASGSLLCQWDDDDLYHPHRLTYQVRALLSSGAAAHFLERWLLWWPKRRLLGLSQARGWEGSMLIHRDALPPYSALVKMEDAVLIEHVLRHHTISLSDYPNLYCYVIYGGNTWGETHAHELFQQASLTYADYEAEIEHLSNDYPIKEYEAFANSRSLENIQLRRGALDPIVVEEKTFGEVPLSLDGVTYIRCTFNGSMLIYFGGAFDLSGCTFNNVEFRFEGAAKHTFDLIRLLRQQRLIGAI